VGRLIAAAGRHRGLLALLGTQILLGALLFGRASPFATAPVECYGGALAEIMLHEPDISAWDGDHGPMGGIATAVGATLPLFAVFDANEGFTKVLALLLWSALGIGLYALFDRRLGRATALLAAAPALLPVPLLLVASTNFSNYHWTSLLFDWGMVGAALWVLEAPDRTVRWALAGLVMGFGVFTSVASLPFLGLAALLTLGAPRATWRLGIPVAITSTLPGIALLVSKLRHDPFGVAVQQTADPIAGRLTTLRLDPSALSDLLPATLGPTLHFADAFAGDPSWAQGVEWAWVVASLAGLVAAAVATARRLRSEGLTQAAALAAMPVVFVVVFVLALVVLGATIEETPWRFTNPREHSHRALLPLILGLSVASAVGFGDLARRHRAWLLAGLLPAGLGVVSLASLALAGPGDPAEGFSSYRGRCPDVIGYYAAQRLAEPESLHGICDRFADPDSARQCRAGAAWGLGWYGAVLGPAGTLAAHPLDQRCLHVPPDIARRCHPWTRGTQPRLDPGVAQTCADLPAAEREDCLLGIGWFLSLVDWGFDSWPLDACESLPTDFDRSGCWRGFGFHLGDHLPGMPDRLRRNLDSVPPERRGSVAEGIGYSLGRTFSSRGAALALCAPLEADAAACVAGTSLAPNHRQP